jgi:beta-galactosidase
MRHSLQFFIKCALGLCFILAVGCSRWMDDSAGAHEPRGSHLLDAGWRFHAGEVADGQNPALDVDDWELVEIPHDYMIEGKGERRSPATKVVSGLESPFDRNSPAGGGGGYLNGGVGWYRKTFTIPESMRGMRISVEFEGVYMDSDVWVNGVHLGNRPFGYIGFQYDLTDHIGFGEQRNVLAVRAKCPQPNSRWYSGAGIYRHVWLHATDPIHVAPSGVYVTTPKIGDAQAMVRVEATVANRGHDDLPVSVEFRIRDAADRIVARSKAVNYYLGAGEEMKHEDPLIVKRPRRWSLETPCLYTMETLVHRDGRLCDLVRTPFGFRDFEYTLNDGFYLNGKRTQIYGVCLHHDLGPLGAAAYDRAIERQLEIMRSMGVNAIRTAHNPPAPKLLELCDRMGFLVMDESFDEWVGTKLRGGYGYARWFKEWGERDMRDMLLRDRNHPSIVMWSIGNEIPDQGSAAGKEWAARLAAICRELDPTRPVTSGMDRPQNAFPSGFADPLDLYGLNYRLARYDETHARGITYASETASTFSSRGEYNLQLNADGKVEFVNRLDNHSTSYDVDFPDWGTRAEDQFRVMREKPWVFAEFVWTGFDYIGEPTPYGWPARSSCFGIVDLCGFKKDRFYLYQSQWTAEPMVHLLPHWNWPQFAGKEIPVWAYTNADSVELFLNGKSMGKRNWTTTEDFHLEWLVPYTPGTLRAVASKDGKQVAADEVHTTGEPARIELVADRATIDAGGQDLAFVTARVVDAEGRVCPDADPLIRFSIEGAGTIAAVDNGDPNNLEPFKADRHLAFHGLCLAVVKAARTPGAIVLEATADGLAPATLELKAR